MMSDLDTRDRYYGFSDEDIARLQAEEARAQRWDEFVSTIKTHMWMRPITVARAVWLAQTGEYSASAGPVTSAILAFKDGQQWSDVYGALARAARQVEQERERLLTQG